MEMVPLLFMLVVELPLALVGDTVLGRLMADVDVCAITVVVRVQRRAVGRTVVLQADASTIHAVVPRMYR